jgi:DNA polymerase (family X)
LTFVKGSFQRGCKTCHMDAPSVDILLDVDREYREKARAGTLHTRVGPWHFTARFSNTERAHKLHRMFDWVVIHYSDAEGNEGRATVVTERRGSLAGERVVRGREAECAYGRGEGAFTLEPSPSACTDRFGL